MAELASMTELCCEPLSSSTLNDDDAKQVAAVFKALSDPVRLKLVSIIGASGEVCACDLPEAVDRSQPTVSHHLSQLVKAGLLEREQRGKWAWFTVNKDRLAEVSSILC